MVTDDPWMFSVSIHILYIVLVVIYCAIVFYCKIILSSTGHINASYIASPMGGYNQMRSVRLWGYLLFIQEYIHLWNLPIVCSSWGSITHVSKQNRYTGFTSDFKNICFCLHSLPYHNAWHYHLFIMIFSKISQHCMWAITVIRQQYSKKIEASNVRMGLFIWK